MILHSSGTTSMPKPVPWTHEHMLHFMYQPYFDDRDLCGLTVSLFMTPMFHLLGFAHVLFAASCGIVPTSAKPGGSYPTGLQTPDDIFAATCALNVDIILGIPSVIEIWARNADYVKWMTTRKAVLYAGAPMNKEVGDQLVSQGVSLRPLYGATEFGFISDYCTAIQPQSWDYFHLSDHLDYELIPHGTGASELVLMTSSHLSPAAPYTEKKGVKAYPTSDLVVQHSSCPGYSKIIGRVDEQIAHSTGQKTNPGPLENMLCQDPHIQAAVIFGAGRFQSGAIIDFKSLRGQSSEDEPGQVETLRELIWPTVEKLNAVAPRQSRLHKEMIIAMKPSKPFSYTAKNTVRRQVAIDAYSEEIDALYNKVDKVYM